MIYRLILITTLFLGLSPALNVMSQCVTAGAAGCGNGGYTWEYTLGAGASINVTATSGTDWFVSYDMGSTWSQLTAPTNINTAGSVWILGIDPDPASFFTFSTGDWNFTDCITGASAVSGGHDCFIDACAPCGTPPVVSTCTPPTLATVPTHVTCAGGLDGEIDLTVTGTSTYSYSWTGGTTASSEDLTGLSAGIYTVVVTDNTDATCTASTTVTVNDGTNPIVVANATATSICTGGSVTLTGSGGTSYSWNNGAIDGVAISPAATTTYTVTGQNAAGCTDTDAIVVTVSSSVSGTDLISSCSAINWIDGNSYAASNNTATHTIVAGSVAGCDSIVTLDFTLLTSSSGTDLISSCVPINWIDGNNYAASNNSATHTIVGGASSGCDSVVTLDLTINSATTGIDVITSCAPINWIDGNNYAASNNTATHTLVGGASNGCDSVVTLDFTIQSAVTGTDVILSCNPIVWIDGNNYAASNNTATHTLVGAAANGCDSIVTLDFTLSTFVSGTDIQVDCSPLTWIDGNTYASSNNTATHTIVGGAASGCDSVVTLDYTLLPGSTGTDVQVSCVTYTWIDGNTYATSTNAATFNIVGGAANGCDSLVTLDLTITPFVTGTDIQANCDPITWIDGNTYAASNNTATHTIAGGSSAGCDSVVTLDFTLLAPTTGTDVQLACGNFVWIDGINYLASNNTATFTLVNAAGCDSVVTLDLTVTTGSTGTDTQTACGSFIWIDGNTYFASTNTVTHTIVGGASTGCDSVVTLDLTINPLPVIYAGLDQTLCDGDPVTLSAIGVTDIVWSPIATNNVSFIQPVGTIVYTATGTDANGCIGTDDVMIAVNDLPNTSFSFSNVCEGATMDFVSTSNVNNGTITNSDWSFGDAIPGTGNGVFTSYQYGTPGTYDVTLTVTSNVGCVNSVINTVEVYENPIADFTSINAEGCADLCVDFNNNSSATVGVITNYLWTLGNGNVDMTANPTVCYGNSSGANQSYDVTLTVTTDLGCVATSNQAGFVTVYPIPVADFTPSAYETTVLTPLIDFENESTLGSTYTWDFFGEGISIEENPSYLFPDQDTATYEVCLEVVSANGCVDDTCQLISISGFEGIYIPNAFSPNDDGINELFIPQLEGISDLEFKFLIFNRWGELIYESTDPQDVVWDGTHKSVPVQIDTYIWKVEGIFNDSRNPIDKTGHVVLIR